MISNFRMALLLAFTAAIIPVAAQTAANDAVTSQAVELFIQSCLPFSGDAAGLRNWIAERHLPQLPAQSAAFLGNLGSGEVFAASNATGHYVLVSYDIGACKVVSQEGNMQAAENILSAYLTGNGYEQTPTTKAERPDAAMQLYHVTRNKREWLLSVMRHDHSDAPGMAPELDLMATPAGKMPQ
jgi:hypothetical protein